MKNLIMYMYNLNDINVYKDKNKIYIKYNNKKYLFKKIYNEKRIIEVHSILKNKTEYYKIIPNIYNHIITEYNGDKYILLAQNNDYEIKSKNIYLDNNIYKDYSINHSNWERLWKIKNDYYELNRTTNNYLLESKDYYIGLAENAIQFIKLNNIINNELTIAKLRIDQELTPDNAIIDCKEREVAEIIKYNFFQDTLKEAEIDKLLKHMNIKKIIARLLYPNYYFDMYDEFINGKKDINKFKNIISKVKRYENLIRYIYKKYGTNDIIMPEWLKKD